MNRSKCNCHLGGTSSVCPPVGKDPSKCTPQGILGDPTTIVGTSSCFNLKDLPNIADVGTLANALCEVQQKFDKCPLYYTKEDYDVLVDTLNKSLFYLYVKLNTLVGSPWFMGLAYGNTDPIDDAKQDFRDFPGWYIASGADTYNNFLHSEGADGGKPIVVTEEDFKTHIIIFKPKITNGCSFSGGFQVIKIKLGDLEEIYNKISNLEIEITNIQDNITNIEGDVKNIDDRVTILEGKTVVLQLEVTYSELLDLITNSQLNPGQEYKITDYTFTTTQTDTSSAHHDFDIIVVADTINTLNEQARACKKEGDSYFGNNNLAAWELKYSVYNNVNKYSWADEISGKGVIYYLKDDFNNEAGFDFKSALFTKSVLVSYDNNYDEIDPSLEGCNEYLTFHGVRSETTDKSLTGDFYNISIQPLKKLPYIKLVNSGNNIKINAGSAYIYKSSDIELLDGINYISSSLGIVVNGSYNVVTNSYDCLISKSSMQNRIVECRDIKLGFENNANYLKGCLCLTTESRVSSLSIKNWLYCKIETECGNIQSSGFSLKYSTIGYGNQNVILKSSGNVSYKTIASNTFDTSWNEPEEQFEFNQDNLDKLEIISKAPLMTYVD